MTSTDRLRYKRSGLQGIMVVSEHFTRPDFWRSRAPGFHIGDAEAWRSARPFRYGNEEAEDLGGRIRQEGYFRLRHDFGIDLAILAATVRSLSADRIPPVFAFVYDEFWVLFQALDSLYGGLLGPYGYLPDFWIWNVDPQKGDAGWKPHRDKGYASLRADGSPISLTT